MRSSSLTRYVNFKRNLGCLTLCTVCLLGSACGMPKVTPPTDAELSAVLSKVSSQSVENTELELSAMRRTGEILQQTTQYSDRIRLANIYLPGYLTSNGVYTHQQVVSVPLLLAARDSQRSSRELSQNFKDVTTSNPTKSSGELGKLQTEVSSPYDGSQELIVPGSETTQSQSTSETSEVRSSTE